MQCWYAECTDDSLRSDTFKPNVNRTSLLNWITGCLHWCGTDRNMSYKHVTILTLTVHQRLCCLTLGLMRHQPQPYWKLILPESLSLCWSPTLHSLGDWGNVGKVWVVRNMECYGTTLFQKVLNILFCTVLFGIQTSKHGVVLPGVCALQHNT